VILLGPREKQILASLRITRCQIGRLFRKGLRFLAKLGKEASEFGVQKSGGNFRGWRGV